MRRPATIVLVLLWATMITEMGFMRAAYAQTFTRSTISSDVLGLFSSATGDFDGDGDTDIAASAFTGAVYWLETLPDRTRLVHSLNIGGGYFRNLAVADFNLDGFDDVAVAAYQLNTTYVLMATGTGGANAFTVHQIGDDQDGQFDVCADDVSGDGRPDLVVAANSSNVIQIFQAVGDSLVLADAVNITGSHPLDVATADVDDDGDRDVVVGTDWRGVYWIEQVTLTNWLAHPLGTLTTTTWVSTGDVNADGRDDIVVCDFDASRVELWVAGASGFTTQTLATNILQPRGTVLGDFDMNGTLDIAGIALDGGVFWWRNQGGLQFTYQALTANYQNMGISAGDVDQDGDLDLLICENQQSQLQFYQNMMGTPAVITGAVTALFDGQPLERIPVTIFETGVTAFTNVSGAYSIMTAPGTYRLFTHHPCWTDSLSSAVTATTESPTVLDFRLRRPDLVLAASSLNIVVHNRTSVTEPLPISNPGDGPLHVAITAGGNLESDPWLQVSPAELTILPGEAQNILVTVSPDTTDLAVWDYVGQLFLTTNTCPDSDIVVTVVAYVLDADPRELTPREFGFDRIYPNPFNAAATITYHVPRAGAVSVELFDLTGRLAQTLASGPHVAGTHVAYVDGASLATGVYLVRLQAGGLSETRKLVLLK